MQTVDAFIASYIPRWEGSPGHYLSVDPNDSGNWSSGTKGVGALIGSNYGVTYRTLKAYRGRDVTAADMKALTLAEACAIAKALFYVGPHLDRLAWNRVTASLLDFIWGTGADAGVKTFQNMLDVQQDGVIGVGGETAKAFAAMIEVRGEEFTAGAWWQMRETYYEALVARRPSDGIYLKGWDNRSAWFAPGQVENWWGRAA